MTAQRTVGLHLLDRLAEIGIEHLFGVPGDFNLVFLDRVIEHPRIRWVGTANELNAAYAADGYARCRGTGALLTTFGVGELSAINGVAGSFAEYVPVLHIVGSPSTEVQAAGAVLHHTLGDGNFGHFIRAHREFTVAHASLTAANAVAEIDRVITEMLRHRRPGYIAIPTDVVNAPVDPDPQPLRIEAPVCDPHQLSQFSAHAREVLERSRSTVLLADFLVDRFNVQKDAEELARAGALPSATLLLGKSVLDESASHFLGTYVGSASLPAVREAVEGADVLIAAGVLFTDVITAGFRYSIRPERMIALQPFDAAIASTRYPGVPLKQSLAALTGILKALRPRPPAGPVRPGARPAPGEATDDRLTQRNLWPAIEARLRPGDIIAADQGTAYFGIGACRLPRATRFLGQPLWGSIGYAIPAAFGAETGLPERRILILVGDGSALLTAQEIGSMLRDGLKPLLVILNNEGYTVERAIHGPEQRYNDIAQWDWQLLPRALGRGIPSVSMRAETLPQLRAAFDEWERARCLGLVEVLVPKQDVPELLATIVKGMAKASSG